MSITHSIAEFCVHTNYSNLSDELIEKSKNSIIDTYGVIHSGYKEKPSDLIMEWIKNQGSVSTSTVLGYNFKTSPNLAALANGVMAHVLDYDDIESASRAHPSAVVFPAVLAISEYKKKTGKELITAFALGVEIISKIGSFLNPSHHHRGWHPTSTLGTLGSAVAAGKLLNFNVSEMKKVLGLASTMVFGLRKNFGTMTKSFHVGLAAKNGIEAAQLVKEGFTASEKVFDGNNNFAKVYSDEKGLEKLPSTLGNNWALISPVVNLKKYPCCYASHRIADAALELINNNDIDLAKVTEIECRVPQYGLTPLAFDNPKDGFEAKFSLEYIVSAMLVKKELTIDTFNDNTFNNKEIANLMSKVNKLEDLSIEQDRAKGNIGYVNLKIKTYNDKYEKKVFFAKGTPENPLTKYERKKKFLSCTSFTLENTQAKEILSLLENVEKNSLDLLTNYIKC